jgi:serine/threonine-protein kinase
MNVPHSDCYVPVPLAADLAVGAVVGDYLIEQKLDEGGMATVYGAVHRIIGKKAAIKVMSSEMSANPSHVQRFVQEARAANAVRHPNIVDVFDFGTLPDGRSYFMMEWLQGETLHHRMSGGRLPLDESLHIAALITDALEAVHAQGIVHRDLKPANVFLVPQRGQHPTPKLLDFGVAKLLNLDDAESRNGVSTMRGQIVGTPEYLSPEQALGLAVDGRSDLYALGVMLFEMVLGQLPIVGDGPIELVRRQVSIPPVEPRSLWPQIPAMLEALLLGLLCKEPAARPTASEVRRMLDLLLTQPSPAPTAHATQSAATDELIVFPTKRRWPTLVMATVAVCLVGLGAAMTMRNRVAKAQLSAVAPAVSVVAPASVSTNRGAIAPERISSPVMPPPAIVEPPRKPSRANKPSRSRDPDYLLDPFAKSATPRR